MESRNITFEMMHGFGFDGTNTMSGHRSGVQTRLRVHAPSTLYMHCCCYKLQLAAVNAAAEHTEVTRVLGTLLTIWKVFHLQRYRLNFRLLKQRCGNLVILAG